ncbi:MAG: biotin transporter BioY [Elusimicrobia bacterium]|nr:biotin transporter BioY [Elusimicrobiota bacterium]
MIDNTAISVGIPIRAWWARPAQILFFSFFIAGCAQLEIFLPFTPVPITGQTFAVLLTGAWLGSRLGVAAVLAYLMEGNLGLPFFAGGGAGFQHLMGPTGGYLLGFLPAAWSVGKLAEKGWDRDPFTAALMMFLGSAVIFAFGLLGLARFVPFSQLLALGLYPFLIGDVVKICLGAAVLPWGWKWIKK